MAQKNLSNSSVLFTFAALLCTPACSSHSSGEDENESENSDTSHEQGIGGQAPVEAATKKAELPIDECEGESVPRQAYLCAGEGRESRIVSQRTLQLIPNDPTFACDTVGTNLVAGKGELVSSPAVGGGAGGGGAGGAGGSGSDPLMWDIDPWCEDAPEGTALAGVSYSVNDCGGSELRLPIRFTEPNGWYRVRVFAGDTPCDRDELLGEVAGTGNGEVAELGIDAPLGSFISLELVVDQYSYTSYFGSDYSYASPGSLQFELTEVEANTP